MRSPLTHVCFGSAVALTLTAGALRADEGPTKDLLDLSAPDAASHLSADKYGGSPAKFKIVDGPNGKALEITIPADSKGYPGLVVKPDTAWDLSAFGHVEVKVTNTGAQTHFFAVRVDNDGDWQNAPWNTEQTDIKAGGSTTIRVIFGYAFAHQPGYDLNPKAVIRVLFFTNGAKDEQTFRIDSLVAGGPAGEKPPTPPKGPVDPNWVRIVPPAGVILGAGAATDPASATKVQAGAGAATTQPAGGAPGLQVELPATKGVQTITFKPPIGRWNLTQATDIYLKVKNQGQTPVTLSAQASSDRPTDQITAPPLAPGAEQEIVVPFAAVIPWQGKPYVQGQPWRNYDANCSTVPGTGTSFASDAVSVIKLSVSHDAAASLLVESVTAKVTIADLPDWLGKRPPVAEAEAGNWVKTLDDEFDGTAIDLKTWNIYSPNYWDGQTHWSKDNLILGGGVLRMRFEKKKGTHNDVPDGKRTAYVCGFLDTYGKWVQRYGYFEARVKLPDVPGLWPTFWLQPDRGGAAGAEWVRESTGKLKTDTGVGGMELDIMEHLTCWGPYRYNIAQHWDGYRNEHKATGSGFNYLRPDKDGFITVGMLWTPGHLSFYCNGKLLTNWDSQRIADVPAHIIFETTTGGWDNNAVDDKTLPADYIVQYIRVWQRKDLASSVDGYQTPPAPWPLKPPF